LQCCAESWETNDSARACRSPQGASETVLTNRTDLSGAGPHTASSPPGPDCKPLREARMTLTLCGYQVFISAAAGTVQVTCPDLPRLRVTERTIGRALAGPRGPRPHSARTQRTRLIVGGAGLAPPRLQGEAPERSGLRGVGLVHPDSSLLRAAGRAGFVDQSALLLWREWAPPQPDQGRHAVVWPVTAPAALSSQRVGKCPTRQPGSKRVSRERTSMAPQAMQRTRPTRLHHRLLHSSEIRNAGTRPRLSARWRRRRPTCPRSGRLLG